MTLDRWVAFLVDTTPLSKLITQSSLALTRVLNAEATVQEYLRVANGPKMKVVASPFLSKGFVGADERGALAASASSILMRLMWLARLARPDLLRVVTWLATMVQSWTQACDAYLYRAMCYLE